MNEELDIKLDKFGNIDMDYYIAEAHKMRSEYHAQIISSLKTKLITLLSFELPKISIGRHVQH